LNVLHDRIEEARLGGIDTIFDFYHDRSAAWGQRKAHLGVGKDVKDSSLGPLTVGIRIHKPSNGEATKAAREMSSAPSTPITFAMLPHIQLPSAIPPVMAAGGQRATGDPARGGELDANVE
jgi:hypothetical protein